jgi:hypothetical protein
MAKFGSGTYQEGFADGWRAVLGQTVPVPTFLARSVPAGRTPYQAGYDHGAETARREKSKPS